MNEFLGYISDIKHISFEDLKKEGYRTLLESMGFQNITFLVELLIISFEENLEKKEMMLEEWFDNHKPVSDAYEIRARIAKDKSEYDRAERNYDRALELNPDNASALNNYGYMLMGLDKDADKAKQLFERAINIMPRLTEARLNLGCVLSNKLGDMEGANAQYEKILSYDPTEEKAYNNLANILRRYRPFSKQTAEKVCKLFDKALELNPNYIEAHLNYANYLSEFMFSFDNAETHLQKIAAIEPKAKELVSVMLLRNENLRKQGAKSFNKNEPCRCGSGSTYEACCSL